MHVNKVTSLTTFNETLRNFEAENQSQNIEDVVLPMQIIPTVNIRSPLGEPLFYDVETVSMTVVISAAADYYGVCGQVPSGEIWEVTQFAGAVNTGSAMTISRSGIARSAGQSDLIALSTQVDSTRGAYNSSCILFFRETEILYYFLYASAWTSGNATFTYTVKKYKK